MNHLKEAIERWEELAKKDFKKAEDFAFEASGCEAAYPTWWMKEDGTTEKVDCVHLDCRIRRGEFKRPAWAVRFNSDFRGELSNWLRFEKETAKGRKQIAALYWAQKKAQKFDIMGAVAVATWGSL
jgi:hypothetical protein